MPKAQGQAPRQSVQAEIRKLCGPARCSPEPIIRVLKIDPGGGLEPRPAALWPGGAGEEPSGKHAVLAGEPGRCWSQSPQVSPEHSCDRACVLLPQQEGTLHVLPLPPPLPPPSPATGTGAHQRREPGPLVLRARRLQLPQTQPGHRRHPRGVLLAWSCTCCSGGGAGPGALAPSL